MRHICADDTLREHAKKFASPITAAEALNLSFVKMQNLRLDEAYQRGISDRGRANIRRMIAAFDWAKFGALTVSPGPNDTFSIIDGQHRAIAASALGIAVVPVVIGNPECEALNFVGINKSRTSVTPVDTFRAQLAAGDEHATTLARILDDLGIEYGSSQTGRLPPKTTRSISQLQTMLRIHGGGFLFTALEMLCDEELAEVPNNFSSTNIYAVTTAVARVITGEGDIDHLAKTLKDLDLEDIQDKANQLRKIKGGHKKTHAADLIIQAYNKNRKHRIS